ncbi:DUF397 domain-containing protein [Flindersiella endophytica]
MNWRKSSYSNSAGGNCVEVAGSADRMAVRDSKDRGGPVLAFDRTDWTAFLASLAATR